MDATGTGGQNMTMGTFHHDLNIAALPADNR